MPSCSIVHAAAMATDIELKRHVFRRLTFGPHPGDMDRVAAYSPDELVTELLAAPPLAVSPPELGSDDDYGRVTQWWVDLLRSTEAGLHERMVWFWHGHLTSGIQKAAPSLMVRQNLLIREHALGNFRTLLQQITIDAAMLGWLDGDGSTVENPNENHARELMELFTLGHGSGYTEQDVHYGAIALAGWWVDDEAADSVVFDDSISQRSVPFLGGRVTTATDVIDAVCIHPALAPHIAGRMYWTFHGTEPADDVRNELATIFLDSGLEIQPLVEAIVRHPTFLDNTLNRPKTGLEWYISLCNLYGTSPDWSPLEALGHVPFNPPNVAGWPGHSRWTSVGAELAKAQIAWDYVWEVKGPEDSAAGSDLVADLLSRASLDVSSDTRRALDTAYGANPDDWEPFRIIYALIAMCPEFNLA